jgi:hypothetical protein
MKHAAGIARSALPTAIALAVCVLAMQPAAALTCLAGRVSATGATAAGPKGAGNAYQAWSAKVTSQYGSAYATWNNAHAKSINCIDVNPKPPPNSPPLVPMYQCTAVGSPCKP